ncbi:MAG: hypothetical protein CMH57_10720 [Myxococcales bacterium]|nr:hypothetical protein [Myxococcales bacterium]
MKLALAFVISLAIGGALLYLAAADLPLGEVVAYFQEADPGRLGAALAVYGVLFSVVHLLRMWRWAFLLKPIGEFEARAVFRAASIGFMAIVVLPLRLGELVRPYVLAKDTEAPMAAALGTAVVERVVDGLFITLLLFVTLGTYSGEQGSTAFALGVGYVALAVFSGALVVCVTALWRREWTLRLLRGVGERVSVSLTEKVVVLLGTFLDGVEGLREGGALAPFLVVTVAYWTVNGLSIAFLATAGFGLELGPWEGMTVLAVLVVGLMIPTGPGLAGNYELFAMQGLGLFVAEAQVVVAGAALVASMHVVQFVVQVAPGLVMLWGRDRGLLSLVEASGAELEAEASDEGG